MTTPKIKCYEVVVMFVNVRTQIMEIATILKEFRAAIERLYAERLKNIILYGSWARGQGTQDSDIDLVVVLDGKVAQGHEIDRMIDIITDINLKHDVLLSIYPVSQKDYASTNSPLLLNIRREGVVA